jgi:hypothetical protein
MWRRLVLLPALATLAVSLSACSGVEGQRAQELLLQAQVAESQLHSAAFEGQLSFGVEGESVRIDYEGAGSDAGQFFAMRSAGELGIPVDISFVVRGKRAWWRQNGSWEQVPVPAELGAASRSASLGSAAFQELTKHVKDVRVTEHQVVGGEPSAIIGGELDTAGLLASVGKLSELSDELDGLDLDSAGLKIGDISATLTISERTHLLTSALVKLSIEARGEQVDLQLTYRLTAANSAVRIPIPS